MRLSSPDSWIPTWPACAHIKKIDKYDFYDAAAGTPAQGSSHRPRTKAGLLLSSSNAYNATVNLLLIWRKKEHFICLGLRACSSLPPARALYASSCYRCLKSLVMHCLIFVTWLTINMSLGHLHFHISTNTERKCAHPPRVIAPWIVNNVAGSKLVDIISFSNSGIKFSTQSICMQHCSYEGNYCHSQHLVTALSQYAQCNKRHTQAPTVVKALDTAYGDVTVTKCQLEISNFMWLTRLLSVKMQFTDCYIAGLVAER